MEKDEKAWCSGYEARPFGEGNARVCAWGAPKAPSLDSSSRRPFVLTLFFESARPELVEGQKGARNEFRGA